MKVSLVVVCHHSSAVLPDCVAGFRREAVAAGLDPEVVVVEHSDDDAQATMAAGCRPEVFHVQPNRGYAAGLNAGAARASGEVLLLGNPDIRFRPGSVAPLVDALTAGADVAGPQLLWDDRGEVLLPIPDDPSPTAELARTLRRRRPGRRGLEGLLNASWRAWTAEDTFVVPSLRGPLMALTSDTFDRLGPLDEGYFLYYEETEWLWRARQAGARLVVAPRSRVVHRWGHATGRRPDAAAIEERSRARFFRRNYSPLVRVMLRWAAPKGDELAEVFTDLGNAGDLPAVEADVWLLSIVGHMEPAVGCLRCRALPPAARELTSAGRWYAVAARREGGGWRLSGSWTWRTG